MPTTDAKMKKIGSVSELLRYMQSLGQPADASIVLDLKDAPSEYKRAIASNIETDVFQGVDTLFPVLFKNVREHHMRKPDFLTELELIIGMADIRDPKARVYIYALQVTEPRDLCERLNKTLLESVAPTSTLVELMNGYVRHEILYELPNSHRNMILVHLLESTSKLRISLKPPHSLDRIESTIEFEELTELRKNSVDKVVFA